MASTYPSVVATLTNPNPTDKLNSPSHATIESNQNNEVIALETFVGTLSSAVGTLVYDIRATGSGGGGHVQSANKGGTGQTSFNKGDILAASSSSVLGKLGVGADTQTIIADSTQTSGMKWAAPAVARSVVPIGGPISASGNSTIYTGIGGVGVTSASEPGVEWPIPIGGTFKNLQLYRYETLQGSVAQTITYILRKNEANTPVSIVSASSGAASVMADLVNSVVGVSGDRFSIQITAGSVNGVTGRVSGGFIEFDPT